MTSKTALAKLVSRIFDPIVIAPILLILGMRQVFVESHNLWLLGFILGVDVVLPGLALGYLVKSRQIKSGWDIRNRQERIPLFILIVGLHAIPVLTAWYLELIHLAQGLTALWVMTAIYAVITVFWKISIHSGINSLLAIVLVMEFGAVMLAYYLIVMLVMWSRVVGGFHRPAQVIGGALLPLLVLPAVMWWLGG